MFSFRSPFAPPLTQKDEDEIEATIRKYLDLDLDLGHNPEDRHGLEAAYAEGAKALMEREGSGSKYSKMGANFERCVVDVTKKLGGNKDLAFAICTKVFQKSGQFQVGTNKLTAKGKKKHKEALKKSDMARKHAEYEKLARGKSGGKASPRPAKKSKEGGEKKESENPMVRLGDLLGERDEVVTLGHLFEMAHALSEKLSGAYLKAVSLKMALDRAEELPRELERAYKHTMNAMESARRGKEEIGRALDYLRAYSRH